MERDTTNVDPDRVHPYGMYYLLAVLVGMAVAVVMSVPAALFLTHYGSANLPYVFVASAVLNFGLGRLLLVWRERYPVSVVLQLCIGGLAFMFALAWLAVMNAWLAGPFIFLLLVLAWASYDIFHAATAQILNKGLAISDAQRLQSDLAVIETVAIVLTSVVIILLVPVVSPLHLLLIAACTCFGVVFAIRSLVRLQVGGHAELLHTHSAPVLDDALNAPPYFRYVSTIVAVTALAIFTQCAIGFFLNEQALQQYVDVVSLTSFFALFFACVAVLQCVCVRFVLKPLLAQAGLIFTLQILPLCQLFLGALILALGLNSMAYLFGLMALWAAITRALATDLSQPALQLFYQPLPDPIRRQWLRRIDIVVVPMALLVTGCVLLILERRHLSLFLMVLSVMLVALLSYTLLSFLREPYRHVLRYAIQKHYWIMPQWHLADDELIAELDKKLQSRHPEEMIYALDALATVAPSVFAERLIMALNHPQAVVRRYALEQIVKRRLQSLASGVRKLYAEGEDIALRADALRAYIEVLRPFPLADVRPYLYSEFSELALEAVVGLIAHLPASPDLDAAMKVFYAWLRSALTDERILAARVLERVSVPEVQQYLLNLLHDNDLSVRRAAIRAAAHYVGRPFIRALVHQLSEPRVKEPVLLSLQEMGEQWVPHVAQHFDQYRFDVQQALLMAMASVQDTAVLQLIQGQLQKNDFYLRQVALNALYQKDFQLHVETEFSWFEAQLQAELQISRRLQAIASACVLCAVPDYLYAFLRAERMLNYERVLHLLAFYYSKAALKPIAVAFSVSLATTNFHYTLELLEQILLPKHRLPIVSVMRAFVEQKTDSRRWPHEDRETEFMQVFDHWPTFSPIFYAGLIYFVIKEGWGERYRDHVMNAAAAAHPLLQETGAWALEQL